MAWTIDTAHSEINFSVRHMMISNVRGSFQKFSGTVEFDEQKPENTKVDVLVEVASINTREEQRDAHLRSADFFNAELYPNMHFKSTKVEILSKDRAKLTGDLTIKDVTLPVTLDVEYSGQAASPFGTTNAGFSASTKVNRRDFGLTWNVALETGGVLVGDEIKINIELEIVKQPEAEAVQAA